MKFSKISITFQYGTNLCNHSHSTSAQILPSSHLLEENGDATGKHGNEVNQQKCPWEKISAKMSLQQKERSQVT